MSTEVNILMAVDLSEGADSVPECKGIYPSWKVAHDNAVVLLTERIEEERASMAREGGAK